MTPARTVFLFFVIAMPTVLLLVILFLVYWLLKDTQQQEKPSVGCMAALVVAAVAIAVGVYFILKAMGVI